MSTLRARLHLPKLAIVEPLARRWDGLPRWGKALVLLAVLAFCIWYPTTLSRGWQSVLFYPVGIYILLSLGLNVVVGRTGMLDLGYVAFFAVGAYSTAKLTADELGGGLHTFTAWEVILLAVILAMAAGVTLGGPTLRLRGDYLAIVTLGFGEIVRIVALNSGSLGEARGIRNIPHPTGLPGLDFGSKPLPYVYLVLAGIVVAIVLIGQLERSRVGRAWTAIREDEDAAELMGVPTFKMKLWSFAIGASTGGLAGWIFASKVGFINPDTFPLNLSFLILAAVVLGGLGSTPGVIVGAFLVAFLPEYFRQAAGGDDIVEFLNRIIGGSATDVTEYRYFLFGLALVIMMIFRPQGVLPSRQRAAELAEATGDRGMGSVAGVGEVDAGTDGEVVPEATLDVPSDVELPEDYVTRAAEVAEEVLVLDDVRMQFGGVVALNGVSITVHRGQIFGVIGPNGAGKTTLFNCITGVFQATSGDVRLEDVSLVGKVPHLITEAGIARTFQNIRLFPNMSAIENVMVGTDARHTTSVPGAIVGSPKRNREERLGRAEAIRLLEFMGIAHRAEETARNLPYGDQRRLEIARAIATQPKVLLLDEPAAGFNPAEKQALVALIRQIRAAGLTVVLIEHDMEVVMEVCDRIAVIDFGEKIAEGLPEEIQSDPLVIQAYLGVAADAQLEDVHVHYGSVEALKGISVSVAEGEVVTLIGANGAGKTTTLKTISGIRPVTSGRITFEGEDITGMAACKLVDRGLLQAPEGRGIFPGMSVLENLEMGAYARKGKDTAGDLERVFELFPRLLERRTQPGGTLSGGEQQMLAIGRALMGRPKLLLLDEPSMGLAPKLVAQIFSIITEINAQGTTILLVEQNATQALQRAHRAYVLEVGRVVKTDDANALLDDDAVRAAYLGTTAPKPDRPPKG